MTALLGVPQTLADHFVLPLVSSVLPPILVLIRGRGSVGRRWRVDAAPWLLRLAFLVRNTDRNCGAAPR